MSIGEPLEQSGSQVIFMDKHTVSSIPVGDHPAPVSLGSLFVLAVLSPVWRIIDKSSVGPKLKEPSGNWLERMFSLLLVGSKVTNSVPFIPFRV